MPKNFLNENRWFLVGWLLLLMILVAYLLRYNQAETFILLNPWHTPALDLIFRALTFLGDGIFIIAAALVFFLMKRKRLSILIAASYAFSGLIVQILKNAFPADRPKLYFENHHIQYDYFLNNITLHTINSFPSGHTASVFALAASMAFMSKNKYAAHLLYLLSAILVAYSRIYLGQHFPVDVTAGTVIGVCSAIVCYLAVGKYYHDREKNI